VNQEIAQLAELCLAGHQLEPGQIETLLAEADELYDLLYWADRIRRRFFGNRIRLCCIVPGRLGGCSEDCKFCAQSARYATAYRKPRTVAAEKILEAAALAGAAGVTRFGIVYSGRSISEDELARVEQLVKEIKGRLGLNVCASLGVITTDQARRLAGAGLTRYNHNLETSERHFAEIVTTHTYTDRIRTIEAAVQAGLRVCAGGIFGIGETDRDRIDMALSLRRLGVDTVTMNFLHPIEGTPLGRAETLEPRQILRIIALYRFIRLPDNHRPVRPRRPADAGGPGPGKSPRLKCE